MVCLLGVLYGANSLGPGRTRGLKPPPLPSDTPLPEAKWISQRLDHFAPVGTHPQWNQRYFVNSTWWNGDGPIFLLLGGEGPADPAWLVADTNIMVMATKYGALVVSVEHRSVVSMTETLTSCASCIHHVYLSVRLYLIDFMRKISNGCQMDW